MSNSAPPPRTALLPLLVLSAAAGLDAGSVAVLNSALPAIGGEFGAPPQALSWAVSGYAVAFAGLLLAGGALADRFPRRRVLVAGLLTLAAGTVPALAAGDFWLVAAGRAVQGAGAAITLPAATALVADLHPAGPARSRALGVFASAQAGSYGAGLVLGGVLTGVAGWRLVFAVQGAAALLTAYAAVRRLPAGAPDTGRRIDAVGGCALVATVVLVVLGVDLMAHGGGGRLVAAGALAGAGAAGALWWRRGGDALLDRTLLRLGAVRTSALTAVAFYFCVNGALFFVPLYLQDVRGMSPAGSGLAVLPVSAAVTATALVTGRLLERLGGRAVLAAGLLLTGAGVLLWCLTSSRSPYWWPVLAGLVVTGVGQGLAYPALTALGLRDVPRDRQGAAAAVTATALQIGSGLGPAVLAGVASAGATALSGQHLAFAAAAGAVAVAGLAVAAGRGSAAGPGPGTGQGGATGPGPEARPGRTTATK
ncbi:MFS transporter [Streptomyces sp. NPDC052114]|uniref:MFS transporter n=1 Tax=unclassified Streptomyces TaxID=2593676 RepID=UPI003440DA9B